MFSVIILAAGESARMCGINKQLAEIDGLPVFIRSALKFEECGKTAEIIIAAPKEYCEKYERLARDFGITKIKAVVSGGKSRFESVKNALCCVSEECNYIAVHDGARPLISTEDIERVLNDAERYGASIAAARATDTVKIVGKDGFIRTTPPREDVWYAQTPQAFKKEIFVRCAEKIGSQDVTDDSSVLEFCGESVHVTEITSCNMKITRPEDLEAARAISKNKRSVIKK